jgi:2-oxoglutarate ferredoxin oxidoreductase subunit alpha
MGQMVEDVRMAVEGTRSVSFFGMAGGLVPSLEQVAEAIEKLIAA